MRSQYIKARIMLIISRSMLALRFFRDRLSSSDLRGLHRLSIRAPAFFLRRFPLATKLGDLLGFARRLLRRLPSVAPARRNPGFRAFEVWYFLALLSQMVGEREINRIARAVFVNDRFVSFQEWPAYKRVKSDRCFR